MNLKEVSLLFHAGALKEPVIKKQAGGWIVLLPGNHPLNPELEAARGHVRVFKTVDAAVDTLLGIGFGSLRVLG